MIGEVIFMKKTVFIVYGFVLLTGFCFADPIEGYWVNVDAQTGKTMGWEIYRDEGTLYAKGRVGSGTPLIFALTRDTQPSAKREGSPPDKPGQWSGSTIIPDNGMLFKCKMTYHPADGNKYKVETLEMRGQIGIMGNSLFYKRSS
ncbi:hypothetical protein FACS1894109_08740 [Spirochaetia bacterium]|nr:hypothetical protein FACS1894109_08740 [Spirochaetia bacterium]